MSHDAKYERANKRLAELETESEEVINRYFIQVAVNAESPVLKELQRRLKAVRKEQFELYGSIG